MSEQPRSDRDIAFARMLAEQFSAQFSDMDRVQRPNVGPGSYVADLLASLESQVSQYSGTPPAFLPPHLRRFLEDEIAQARRLFAANYGGVLVLERAGNGFGLDVIVDIFNGSARRALATWGQHALGFRDEGAPGAPPPPPPPLTREWAEDVERGPAPVRRASEQDASASFLTLFTDALRMIAKATGSSSHAPVYTANCNLKGWILESWPQYKFSPTRFGSQVTWPVTDTLPTSGNYMFQGLKGTSVRQDPTPHYLGPSRTQTLVNL